MSKEKIQFLKWLRKQKWPGLVKNVREDNYARIDEAIKLFKDPTFNANKNLKEFVERATNYLRLHKIKQYD
jgi:hypothetical protein